MQLTLGETGNLNPIVAMYRSKSEHGMYEAQAPKTVHFEADVDVDKIKAQIAAVNRAGHLNMTEGADGVCVRGRWYGVPGKGYRSADCFDQQCR